MHDLYSALVGRLYPDETEPPGIGVHLWDLAAHYAGLGLGLVDILNATDAELLAAKGFGPASLAVFRARVPRRYAVPRTDPWREHAEMVARSTHA